MNEEDYLRFKYYYPIYLSSLQNNPKSSATEGTRNFSGAYQVSERQKIKAQVELLTRDLEVLLKAKYDRENHEVARVELLGTSFLIRSGIVMGWPSIQKKKNCNIFKLPLNMRIH